MNFICPCEKGEMVTVTKDLNYQFDGGNVIVYNITINECTACKNYCTDSEAGHKIDSAIERKYPNFFKKFYDKMAFRKWIINERDIFTDQYKYPIVEGAD